MHKKANDADETSSPAEPRTGTSRGGTIRYLQRTNYGSSSTPTPDCPSSQSCTTNAGIASARGLRTTIRQNAWPRTIVYRNLRHHAATSWFHEEMGEPWEVVALYLGDKLTTVLSHHVGAGEDALRRTVNKLETL